MSSKDAQTQVMDMLGIVRDGDCTLRKLKHYDNFVHPNSRDIFMNNYLTDMKKAHSIYLNLFKGTSEEQQALDYIESLKTKKPESCKPFSKSATVTSYTMANAKNEFEKSIEQAQEQMKAKFSEEVNNKKYIDILSSFKLLGDPDSKDLLEKHAKMLAKLRNENNKSKKVVKDFEKNHGNGFYIVVDGELVPFTYAKPDSYKSTKPTFKMIRDKFKTLHALVKTYADQLK